MFRLSRTLPKDPLVGSKIDIIITIFAFFPRNCSVLGVQEERREEKGKGEGGRGKEEEREDRVFLTFWMVTGRACRPHRMRDDLGKQLVLIMAKFRPRRRFKKVRFSAGK